MSQAPRKKKGSEYRNIDEDDAVVLREGRKWRRQRSFYLGGLAVAALLFLLAIAALLVVLLLPEHVESAETCQSAGVRVNCIPEGGRSETQEVCLKRGCCWDDTDTPSCFYPAEFGYAVSGQVVDTPTGMTANVTRKAGQPSQYGGDIDTVRVDFFYETPYRLRVKVSRLSTCPQLDARLNTAGRDGARGIAFYLARTVQAPPFFSSSRARAFCKERSKRASLCS